MRHTTVPDGSKIACVNPGEVSKLYHEIFLGRSYLRHGIALEPGDVVFDVGANIGMATMFFHRECPDIVVHSFEPAPLPYEALVENRSTHGVRGSADRVAVSCEAGTRTFTYYPNATLMSGFYPDVAEESALTRAFLQNIGFEGGDLESMVAHRYQQVEVPTEVTTLSAQIAKRGVEAIGMLKVDVEKSELDVLAGLSDADWPRIRQVVMEVHDVEGRLSQVCETLAHKSFEVVVEQQELLTGTNLHEVFAARAR